MNEADLYSQLAERHGHYCPMSTLGLRLGIEVVRRLTDVESTDWRFCYQARTCAADGIVMALEQSPLPSALQVEQLGQHLLLCTSVDGGELSLSLSANAMRLAAQYRELDEVDKPQHLEMLRTIASEQIIDVSGCAS